MNIIFPKISCFVFGMVSTAFCHFIAKIWFLLFFFASASKLRQLLIMTTSQFSNQFQREFDSNVAIRTFEFSSASSLPCQTTNLLKRRPAVTSRRRPLFFPPCEAGRVRVGIRQTESKGNFCLITVYNHKTLFYAQAFRAKKTNFSKLFFSLSLRSGERVGVRGYFAPPIGCGDCAADTTLWQGLGNADGGFLRDVALQTIGETIGCPRENIALNRDAYVTA
jgi:hypothetical protein